MQLSFLLTVIATAFAVRVTAIAAPAPYPNKAAPAPPCPKNAALARSLNTVARRQDDDDEWLRGRECYEVPWEMGGSVFSGAPLIEDCQKLADSLPGNTTKEIDAYDRPYAVNGTCAFVVRVISCIPEVEGIPTFMGDRDVRRIIRNTIEKYGYQGRVGGIGFIRCNYALEYVQWMIQRNYIWEG
ncbi:hypothetical protein VTJ49DRAFT_2283 [Mycothermus thermophilus]|uniref:Ecp2 effector protein-like domain-containing protein n=1 Tax=Humicola insolens TaxID=85995 RepID=A0ABR3VA47_HUMIN